MAAAKTAFAKVPSRATVGSTVPAKALATALASRGAELVSYLIKAVSRRDQMSQVLATEQVIPNQLSLPVYFIL